VVNGTDAGGGTPVTVAKRLDCRGLSCPLPIIMTKRAIDALAPGEVLEMTATDPGSVNDMAAWAQKTGNDLVGSAEAGGVYTFTIRKVGRDGDPS
jgi:tRNA 2-thiouridine synthesizing protein A